MTDPESIRAWLVFSLVMFAWGFFWGHCVGRNGSR